MKSALLHWTDTLGADCNVILIDVEAHRRGAPDASAEAKFSEAANEPATFASPLGHANFTMSTFSPFIVFISFSPSIQIAIVEGLSLNSHSSRNDLSNGGGVSLR